MILTTTSQKLQAFIEGAHTTSAPTFTTTYADITTTTFTPDGTFGTLNGATPVDMIIAPAASTQRVIKALQINNIDTVSHTVTVRKLDTATPYILASILVLPNSFLRFSQESGWQNGPVTGPGTVFSVAFTGDGTVFNATVPGSPITTTGTFAPSLHTQSANMLFAGPTTGAAAAPTFRSIVAADLPGSFAGFANPSASAGLTAVNGSAATAMRSDGAPALDQSISPTWSGNHAFSNPILGAVGSASAPEYTFTGHTGYGFFYDSTNSAIGVSINGASTGFIASGFAFSVPGGGASASSISGEGSVTSTLARYNSSIGGIFRTQVARGTIALPLVSNNGDTAGSVSFRAYGGTAFRSVSQIDSKVLQASPSDTQMGGVLIFSVTTPGTVTLAEVGRFDTANGFSMFGTNPVIDANRLLLLRNFTVATLPAAPAVGATAFVTDAVATIITGLGLAPVGGGTNKVPCYYDGAWKIG